VVIRDGRPSGGPLMTIDTDVALIEDDELYYRGRPAAELARSQDFEAVCRWLWTRDQESGGRFRPLPAAVQAVRQVIAAAPPGMPVTDRLRIAVPVVAATDPLRDVLDPGSVAWRSGALIATLVDAVDDHGPYAVGSDAPTLAARLARALAGDGVPVDERDGLVRCLNAALVLLVDHDLAVSTLAARAAASARANPYAVVVSGLGALDSALHGNASRSAARMLAAVLSGRSPRQVVAETIAGGRGGVPGFGHRIYTTLDPRAELIMELLAELPSAGPAIEAADQVTRVITDHGTGFRNVDLALATLVVATGMAEEAGEVIFAIARIGGWIAHAIDEYAQPPLRLRPVGRYIGP
jgi:citrate synthase